MIDSIHFIAGEACEIGASSLSTPPDNLKACLDGLGATNALVEMLAGEFAISPVAEAYVEQFRRFLWEACAPVLTLIVGAIATPRILNSVFSGLW
ncbi:MAG: hypothetical protein F6K24_10210 [Okeania sp. SIO2D1]|nr:hypothetical protein [Okeania sp. SIO2D1]